MGRLAKAPMTKQAMQEEAAVAVMRDFLVVACRQQWGPHQSGPYFPGGSAEQGVAWMEGRQVSSCAPCFRVSHEAVGGRSQDAVVAIPPAVALLRF